MSSLSDAGIRYLAVEGPIGVGKTTLARRLAASLDGELMLEAPDANPFLPRFYRDPRAHALSTQLFFLLQRVQQLRGLAQADLFAPIRVADFMLDKDPLFAELTLEPDDLELYRQVHRQLVDGIPVPDLVIYLQAPVDVLVERIARRGVPYERSIDERYLDRLAEAYARYFHEFDAAPLVIVNAAEIDLVHGQRDYEMLFDELERVRTGRHYFNALPF